MHRLALILALTGCVADGGDEGFNIVNNLAPADNCALTPGGAFLARGTIDKQSPNPYVLTPEFVSRITTGEVAEYQRTIALRGANIEVINAETGVSLKKFKSLFSASLAPMGSTTAAFDIVPVDVIQMSGATPTKRVQLVAKVTAFGALGGSGDNIDGVPYEYPVTVCDGCVANILGACPLPAGTEVGTSTPNSCNQFQDGSLQCCMGPSGPICPPTIAADPVTLTVAKTGGNAMTATISSNPAGITCGAACAGKFNPGQTVRLSVTAGGALSYTWSVGTCAANMPCDVLVSDAQTVTVTIP